MGGRPKLAVVDGPVDGTENGAEARAVAPEPLEYRGGVEAREIKGVGPD